MKHWADASQHITDFDIAPDGKRAVFAARGEVFTVPAKEGSIRNLTNSPGVREQKVAWSPNGKWIAYISDRTGEDEIYIAPQDGHGPEEQITSGHKGFMFQPAWSPDSTKIAWADKDLKLWYVDIKAKKPVEVDEAKFFEIHELLLVSGQPVAGVRQDRRSRALPWSISTVWPIRRSRR